MNVCRIFYLFHLYTVAFFVFCIIGGFEHVLHLTNLQQLDGIWEAFEDLPAEVATGSVQEKMAYLRGRLEDATDPLL